MVKKKVRQLFLPPPPHFFVVVFGSGIQDRDPGSEIGIQDPRSGSRIRDWDPGSEIRIRDRIQDKHPGSATLLPCICYLSASVCPPPCGDGGGGARPDIDGSSLLATAVPH
jgi:hypothetical protein